MVVDGVSSKFLSARLLVILALFLCIPTFSQVDTASITGTVQDPSGAVLPGAEVIVTNVDTGISVATTTNGVGLYLVGGLRPGRYRMTVQRAGFKQDVLTEVTANVQDVITRNFTMQVGAQTESVTVTGEAAAINTTDASVGTVVGRETVENMPLNGRSFQGLITLSPGVATVAPNASTTGQFVVNGQRSDTNYFTVDGVSANVGSAGAGGLGSGGVGATPTNSATGGYNSMVSVDALQEFRITTSNFAPEYGRTPGGQISLVSRGGTNAFHGDVFDYFRNTVLNANDWFLKHAGKPRGVLQQNDFGGVVGGRIIKDKLFFFASYEGLRLQSPSPSVKQVPTQAARTLAAAANSGGVVGYMAQFANAYPLPDANAPNVNSPCTSFANCAANYTASFPGRSELNSTSIRIDYSINKSMTLFGRYAHSPSSLAIDNSADTTLLTEGTDAYTAGWTWALNNSMSNDLRFNFTRSTAVFAQLPILFKGSLSTIFPTGFAQLPSGYSINNVNIQIRGLPTDGMLLSPFNADSGNDGQNYIDTFSWFKGSHTFKFGADVRNLDPRVAQVAFNQNNTFANTTTALTGFPSVPNVCPASALPAGSGATVPGYICGQATTTNLQHNYPRRFNIKQYSFFAQDTWKAGKRLSITYGARWDIDPAFTSTNDTPGFSIDSSTFKLADLSGIKINPFGSTYYPTTLGNISPRIGLAYQLSVNRKWGRVVRAGYGVFFDPGTQVGNLQGNPFNARFNNIGAGAIAPIVQYPITNANNLYMTPPNARLVLPVSQGGMDAVVDPNFKLPYVHQFNLTVEQQLGSKQTLSVGYVGALGRRLIGALLYPANKGNPATFAQINPLTNVATPDAMNVIGNYSSSDYHSLQTKFQRQFSGGFSAIASYTWSHSLDDSSQSGQLGTTTLPTAGQLASGQPLELLRGNSDFDIRHNVAVSVVYDFPNPSKGIVRAILGHWSLAPIFHYQTAIPLDVLSGASGSISGTAYGERPNLIPGVPVYVYGSECRAQYVTLQGINDCPGGRALNLAPVSAATAAANGCVAPTAGTASNAKGAFCTPAAIGGQSISGNFGRNVVRAFPLAQFDFSLHRDFPIRESIRLRFQGDVFNTFNHDNFGPEGVIVNAATYGVTSVMANTSLGAQNSNGAGFNPVFSSGGPRSFQFSLKLFF